MKPTRGYCGRKSLARQRGVATLIIGMVILVLATLVTVGAIRVGVREQKISGNEYRYKLAFEAANAGLDYGQMYLNEGRKGRAFDDWTDATDPTKPFWQQCDASLPGWNTTLNSECITDPDSDSTTDDDWIWAEIPAANLASLQDASGNNDTTRQYRVFFVTPQECNDDKSICTGLPDEVDDLQVTIVSEGTSDLSSGETAFQQDQTAYVFNRVVIETNPIAGTPAAPMIAYGTVAPSGTYDIATSPNAAGEGVPVSVWSNGDVDMTAGTPATCQPHEFYDNDKSNHPAYVYDAAQSGGVGANYQFGAISDKPSEDIVLCAGCTCPADEDGLSNSTNGENLDIVDNDPNFPDVFQMVFGINRSQYERIKEHSDTLLIDAGDCSSTLGPSSAGLIWVEDDGSTCDVPSNTEIGTPLTPVLVVVEGQVKMNANTVFFGILYAYSDDPTVASTDDVDLTGGPEFYGAVLIDRNVDLTNGGFTLVYHEKILANLRNNLQTLGRVPGTWTDFL